MTTFDDIELPHWIKLLFSMGSKHQFRFKFLDTHPVDDIDIFFGPRMSECLQGKTFCEIEVTVKSYCERVKQALTIKGIDTARKYLKGMD